MEEPRVFDNSPRKGWYQMNRSKKNAETYPSRNDFRNQDSNKYNKNFVNPDHGA